MKDDPDFAQSYDLIIATSLSNVVPLKALYPAMQQVPLWLYFHENQFAHPTNDLQQKSHQLGWQFQSLQNAFCANWISFNTEFNRSTFLDGVRALFKKLPEKLPGGQVDIIEAQSDVLPVPLTPEFTAFRRSPKERGLIAWNHRWEWDKQPERFLNALKILQADGLDFRLAMLGSGGGRESMLSTYAEQLASHIVCWGEASPDDYRRWVSRAHIGVSSAIHDFQGLSILEMAQAGAKVVVPRRLAYPECLPGAVFYKGSQENATVDSKALATALRRVLKAPLRPTKAVDIPTWEQWRPAYAARLSACLAKTT